MNSLPARYHVIHETGYNYDSPVSLSRQQLHLTPRECPWQQSITHRLLIEPEPTFSHARFDHFGNPVSMFAIEAPHSSLVVRAESVIEVQPHLPADGLSASPPWESVRNALVYGAAPVLLEANRYRFESPYVRVKHEFNDFASHCFTPNRPLLEAVGALMSHIYNEFEFDPKATTVSTPVLKLLEERKGVCQDFAHLMLACLRSHGLAARYVSGYLLTKPPPGKPRMVGADASHAWVSVYCPSAGGEFWIDFDPTNNLMPDTEHITLAWGRDFGDVSPLRGVILGGDTQEPEVAVTVTPSSES
ncbi:MAG TPA: transglutaminase family protein [Candidatus Propionivibrio aalborgensis]|nr:transglutaminase family protein [Candidatus Propionivibrio aalborgensis]